MIQTHLYMRFYFCPQLLQVLNDGAVNSSAEVRVVVGDNARFVANGVIYILVFFMNTGLSYDAGQMQTCRPPSPRN